MATSAATTELLNKLRDTVDGEVTAIAVGTDDTAPTKNDTDLGNEVLKKTLKDTIISGQSVTHVIRILASEANGNDLAEAEDVDSSDNSEVRYTFSDLPKTSDIEVEIRTKKTLKNP